MSFRVRWLFGLGGLFLVLITLTTWRLAPRKGAIELADSELLKRRAILLIADARYAAFGESLVRAGVVVFFCRPPLNMSEPSAERQARIVTGMM